MEKLGIQPIPLLTQIFNFIILTILLTKFLYKPIIKTLDERRKKIDEGLKFSDRMKLEIEKNEKSRTEILAKAKEEARKVIEEAKKTGRKAEEEIVQEAQKEAAKIIERGKKEIQSEKAEMEKQLKEETIEIAAGMVEKLLGEVLSARDQKTIIEKKLKVIARQVK